MLCTQINRQTHYYAALAVGSKTSDHSWQSAALLFVRATYVIDDVINYVDADVTDKRV